jgi:hypothetical protein
MLSSDSATGRAGYAGRARNVGYYPATRFDRGARLFAFCCAVLYAVLTGGLIVAIVKATLQF